MGTALCRFALLATAVLVFAAPAAAAPTGSTLLVSRPDGTAPSPPVIDGPGSAGALSDDGRYAAFISSAALTAGTDPLVSSVFVRDTAAGTTTLVSRSDGTRGATANAQAGERPAVGVEPGTQALDPPHDRPHVLVAFTSKATNLSDHLTGPVATGGVQEIWLRDVTAGTTYLVSRGNGTAGAPGTGDSSQPSLAIASIGPVVGFSSRATSLGTTGSDIYLRTINAGGTQQVSCHQQNCGAGGSAGFAAEPSVRFVPAAPAAPTVCPTGFDCVVVAFSTDDPTITGDASPNREHVVVAGATVSKPPPAPPTLNQFTTWVTASKADGGGSTFANDNARSPSLTPDGLGVAFVSSATNLGSTPPNGTNQIFMRALDGSGSTTLVSRASGSAGAAADGGAYDVSVGGDSAHRRVTFTAVATNFGVTDFFGTPRAWSRDLATNTTVLLDRGPGPSGVVGDGESGQAGTSADGKLALFDSNGHNLGGGDFARVYLRHLVTGALEVVSRPDGPGPLPVGVGSSTISRSAVSADGRYVAFASNSDGLAAGENNRVQGVFVRDLLNGTTTLVSRASGPAGAAANTDATLNGISDNGRRVLFTTSAGNLVAGPAIERPYVRDLDAHTTTVVSRANGPAETITGGAGQAISGDGNSALFITSITLDPDATQGAHLYLRNLAAHTTTFVDRDNGAAGTSASAAPLDAVIDRDGGRVAWTTTAPLTALLTPSVTHVYERDVRAGTTVLVSRAEGPGGASANANASAPAIDAAGDVVAFQSAATNLGAPVTGQAVWVRAIAGGHLQLASRATGASGAVPDGPATAPSLDESGDRVAFRAGASNLVAGAPVSLNDSQAFLRNLPSQATELVSRANGPAGAPIDHPGLGSVSLSANGDCAAFDARGLNIGDGFASAQFSAVHMRVLRGECPAKTAVTPRPGRVPALTRLKVVPKRFAVKPRRPTKKGHKRHSKTHRGTSIRFRLSAGARVTFVFARALPGRKAGKRCVAAHHRVSRGRRCTRYVRSGRFARNMKAGADRLAFSGRIGRHALRLGVYRLIATPIDPLHRRTRSRAASFTVIRAR